MSEGRAACCRKTGLCFRDLNPDLVRSAQKLGSTQRNHPTAGIFRTTRMTVLTRTIRRSGTTDTAGKPYQSLMHRSTHGKPYIEKMQNYPDDRYNRYRLPNEWEDAMTRENE